MTREPLKARLIGVVLVRQGIAVQSHAFRSYLPVGRPEIAIEGLKCPRRPTVRTKDPGYPTLGAKSLDVG